jgi:hypothetical protein
MMEATLSSPLAGAGTTSRVGTGTASPSGGFDRPVKADL